MKLPELVPGFAAHCGSTAREVETFQDLVQELLYAASYYGAVDVGYHGAEPLAYYAGEMARLQTALIGAIESLAKKRRNDRDVA